VLALLINLVIPWNLLVAWLLDRYKAALRAQLQTWLQTWFELEALLSLANFASLNPAAAFPQVLPGVPADSQPVLQAQALGHPLLPPETRVCNDFTLHSLGEVTLVTGSNMAGKSTFLRTLGINLALAFAGGPVIAAGLVTAPFRLFTSIQLSDSLGDGISYFYAEVRRLKALLDALESGHAYPVFFLIDEIFRGTNNLERRAGSRAYLRTLAGSAGAGAVSTHDLALARLADEKPGILNYHFREEVHDGRMAFDYLLRPGPSPTTNALKIMRQAGLPVDEVQPEDA
jgi:DNA mismatch repair ATPase MutS